MRKWILDEEYRQHFLRFGYEGEVRRNGILIWLKEDFAREQLLEHVGNL